MPSLPPRSSRCVREVQQQANMRVQEAEERLSSTVTRYEAQLEQLQDNVADTIGSHSNAVKRKYYLDWWLQV